MGIGRRRFIQLFGATIASAATNPLQALVLHEDWYINRALGIAFQKPPGWHYMTLKDFQPLKDAQIVMDDELSEVLRGVEDPIAVMTKIEPRLGKIGPSITVYAEPFEYEENETLVGFLPNIEGMYKRVLPEYRSLGQAVEKRISNCESLEYFSEFLFEQPSTRVTARKRSVISIREPQIYTMNMFDYPAHEIEAQHEFTSFINTIAYV